MTAGTTSTHGKLDEVMLAMDVVDTLRHRQDLVERELGSELRDAELLDRLREIYRGQGIEVTDEVLAEGVRALHEDRFTYEPPPASFRASLAKLYVRRDRWGKGLLLLATAVALLGGGYYFLVRAPEARLQAAVPEALTRQYEAVLAATEDPSAIEEARANLAVGQAALQAGDMPAAKAAAAELEALYSQLEQSYELRIVSRPNAQSGVWRVPDANTDARNYYLVVEAIAPGGKTLTLPVRSEEDGSIAHVSTWGLRVDEATFERVAADKQDDGIIQAAVVGTKRRGERSLEYDIPTSGAAITRW